MRGARSARDDRWYRTPPSRSGSRSASTARWSWVRLLEGGGLADQPAEPRVDDLKLEQKASIAKFGMRDVQAPGREPRRQTNAQTGELQEVVRGAEDQRGVLYMDRERHADATADIFLKPGRSGKALGRMHNVRKAAATRVKPGPVLAFRCHVLGHGDDARRVRVARDRQRAADQARGLRQQKAGAAHLRLEHFADVNRCVAASEALGKSAADRKRQRIPVSFGHQRAEAQVAEFVRFKRTRRFGRWS